MKKFCWIYHHFTDVHQKSQSYGVWFLRSGVRQTNFFDILGHFFPFTPTPTPLMIPNIKILKIKKWKTCLEILSFYTYMCTKHKVRQTNTFDILGQFLHFSPLRTWKIKILTLKKTPGGIIILHICTITNTHLMYGSWDMECHRHSFLSLWTVFCPCTPPSHSPLP